MSRLVEKLYVYDAYSEATLREGAERGLIGTMKCRWRERYQRSTRFPVVRTNGDKPALDRRAERLARRIQGIWIAYAPLPMLQELPSQQWRWRSIGQPDDEVPRLGA